VIDNKEELLSEYEALYQHKNIYIYFDDIMKWKSNC